MTTKAKDERAQLIGRLRAMKAETEQIFIDTDHWNRVHPDEEPIDPDPDGRLNRMLASINFALACEDASGGVGPLQPICEELNADLGIEDERTKH
jgi:hypothetical protein